MKHDSGGEEEGGVIARNHKRNQCVEANGGADVDEGEQCGNDCSGNYGPDWDAVFFGDLFKKMSDVLRYI